MKNIVKAILVANLVLVGCTETATTPTSTGLVSIDDGEVFAGGMTYRDMSLDFTTIFGEESIDIAISVDKKTFHMSVGLDFDTIDYQGGDNTVSQDDKDALIALHAQLDQHLQSYGDDLPLAPYLTTNMVSWLSESPVGLVHEARELAASKGQYNDGVTCVKKGRYYTAYWDTGYDGWGTLYTKSVQVNKNYPGADCIGRCGSDCGSWWKISSYTLDCLEHDTCLWQTGQNDNACSDEYWHAADDWTLGVPSGCWG